MLFHPWRIWLLLLSIRVCRRRRRHSPSYLLKCSSDGTEFDFSMERERRDDDYK
jgi:hypothetical protein